MAKQRYGPKKGITVAPADGLTDGGKRYTSKKQSDVNRASKQSAARKRHDQAMRSSGRADLATNYGDFPQDKKRNNKKK